MTWIRIRPRVNWHHGLYQIGECYDIEETEEVLACIRSGLLEHIPYTSK